MEEFNLEKKSDRQRKKRYYNSIRQQIEFYFGDVNLSKDRFFGKLLEQSPYIDIDIILQCNKIKKLTSDSKDIVKALKKSNFLSVTEDGTKIFRTVPVAPVTNADDCTIYVEDLPLEVDHEWLKNVFSTYGEVVYVSIPHYKTSNKIKGFAFVQFDSPNTAKKAINSFRSVNSCLSSTMEPSRLRSVQTYEGEKDIVLRNDDVVKVENIKCVKIKSGTPENISNVVDMLPDINKSKTKGADTEIIFLEENYEPQKKKRKNKKDDKSDKETQNDNCVSKTEKIVSEHIISTETVGEHGEIKLDTPQENVLESIDGVAETNSNFLMKNALLTNDEEDINSIFDEKQERKRKRRKKKSEQVQTYGMQLLSKQEWKKLRNKYLEEQKKKMHQLKQQLKIASKKQLEKYNANQKNDKKEENETQTEELRLSECRVKFVPGVIVKLHTDQPIKDVKYFKNEVKRYADVEYIDVSESKAVAYIRCSSNEAANQVMALNKWPNMVILYGDEELEYWEKIKRDRKEKFDNKIRCNTRGKNKLIKKVEAALATHIKFPA